MVFPGEASELVRQLSTYDLAVADTVQVENCSLDECRSLAFDDIREMSQSQNVLGQGGLEEWLGGPDL